VINVKNPHNVNEMKMMIGIDVIIAIGLKMVFIFHAIKMNPEEKHGRRDGDNGS